MAAADIALERALAADIIAAVGQKVANRLIATRAGQGLLRAYNTKYGKALLQSGDDVQQGTNLARTQSAGSLHGTGSAPGITELSARAKSTQALKTQLSREGISYEYVYRPDIDAFAINKRLNYTADALSPHQTIAAALPETHGTTVGGIIRVRGGKLYTDEMSGHYYEYWTNEIRQKFQDFMRQQGFEVIHDAAW